MLCHYVVIFNVKQKESRPNYNDNDWITMITLLIVKISNIRTCNKYIYRPFQERWAITCIHAKVFRRVISPMHKWTFLDYTFFLHNCLCLIKTCNTIICTYNISSHQSPGFGIWKLRVHNSRMPRHKIQRLQTCEKSHVTHEVGVWWHAMIIPFRTP